MSARIELLTKDEVRNLEQKIKEKKAKISDFSFEKLLFEQKRCEQILNRNIPMCLSLHIKNILQATDRKRIVGQLHRLNLECYWKILNLEYLKAINKQLKKTS